MLSRAFAAALALTLVSVPAAFAVNAPSAQCVLNDDKSRLTMVVANTESTSFACTATCQYTLAGERPLYTFDCNYALSPNEVENVACDIDGGGPEHFGELRPTKFVCEPR